MAIESTSDTKPRAYNGTVSPLYHCAEHLSTSDPNIAPCPQIQLANYTISTPLPRFCPFCGSPNIIDDSTFLKIHFSTSLHIPPATFDYLYECFQKQHAYTSLREYISCMLKGAVPTNTK